MPRKLRREDYMVGWVCALPVELAAAQEMLDEEHDDLERDLQDNDENLYALGSICGHNVAIVCLPAGRIGNNPAAAVATQMRATFKGIRFGLMVGIGAGVPSEEADIRLGDVVVSQPHNTFSGVVQYDFGKATPSGFERTGSLNAPPQTLLQAVARVRAKELRGRSRLNEYISKLDHIPKFQRLKAGPDILYQAAYDHEGGLSCDRCRTDMQEPREPRESDEEVVVHYGTIASGNQVIRNAVQRDKPSSELGGVYCFEMEAAGLMNNFPCLVIRGICDYADSHKNKRWQAYAAATAAACAKGVLSELPSMDVGKTHAIAEVETSGGQERRFAFETAGVGGPAGRTHQPAIPNPVIQGFFASAETLCKAVQQGDVDGVRALLASCSGSIETLLAPVMCFDEPWFLRMWKDYWGILGLGRRVTALHCAVEAGGPQSRVILQLLLDALPRSAVDPVGNISIISAINTRRRTPLGSQLSLAEDSTGGYMQTCTVLTWASILGNGPAVDLLIGAGAKINSRENWLSVTPLMAHSLLVAGGDQATYVTMSLITTGAQLDLRDELGNGALHLALAAGNSQIAMRLIRAGASVLLFNKSGERPTDYARNFGVTEQVRTAIRLRREIEEREAHPYRVEGWKKW